MGNLCINIKKKIHVDENNDDYLLQNYKTTLDNKCKIPLQTLVAHYTPSTFPALPILTKHNNELCCKSWEQIINSNITYDGGNIINGITLFYTDFYKRLHEVDTNNYIVNIILAHSPEKNKNIAKCALLIKVIKFILNVKENTEESQIQLYMLGKSHSTKLIKPYFYSIFIQTLLQTIFFRLKSDATVQLMEAWTHQVAFVMRSMLPPAIKSHIVETELFIHKPNVVDTIKISDYIKRSKKISHNSKRITPNSHKVSPDDSSKNIINAKTQKVSPSSEIILSVNNKSVSKINKSHSGNNKVSPLSLNDGEFV